MRPPDATVSHLLSFMFKPSDLTFRIEKLTSSGWVLMGWAGDLSTAQALARNGLGGTCRITNCDPREYRRYARAEAIERGRRVAA